MKPSYYVHEHTETHIYRDKKGRKQKKARKVGEHVMTYKVFKKLSIDRVSRIIGGLAKDKD